MQAALYQLQPYNIPKAFNGNQSTDIIEAAFPNEVCPVSEWSASVWVYNEYASIDCLNTSDYDMLLTWAGADIFINLAGEIFQLPSQEDISRKWVFCQIGSTAAMSYACASIRKRNPIFLSSPTTYSLKCTTSIQVFRNNPSVISI